MYQKIITENKELILKLYLEHNYRKADIAYQLIRDFDLDLTSSQVDSFRRAISRFLEHWDLNNTKLPDILEDTSVSVPVSVPVSAQAIQPKDYKFMAHQRTRAKILLFDLETAPIIAAVWSLWKVNISIDQVLKDSCLICWTGKWLFEPNTFGDCLTPEEAKNRDDARITRTLWDALNEADIVIAHNGRKFDALVANTFFLKQGLMPTRPYEIIDTLDVAKKSFRFTSNKLDFINRQLKLPEKKETKFKLWLACMEGDLVSLNEMYSYCKNDTEILEEVYVILRPYIKAHPNMGFYTENDYLICPTCGHHTVEEYGTYSTPVNQYIAYRCAHCGALGRSRYTSTTIEKKKSLTVSLGR